MLRAIAVGVRREGGEGTREAIIEQIQVNPVKRSVARLHKWWTGRRRGVKRKRNRKVVTDGDRVINTDGGAVRKKGR